MHILKSFVTIFSISIFLAACGDTSETPVSPSNPDQPGSPSGDNPPAQSAVQLPAGANSALTSNMYSVWKSRWAISMDQEIAGGSTLDYNMFQGPRAQELLQRMGDKVAKPIRIRWDNGNEAQCYIDGMTSLDGVLYTKMMNFKTGCSVSEAIGYAMLIAVLQEDWDFFNGLWAYNIIARDYNTIGLMPWMLQSFSRTISTSSALDADLDVAAALIIAHYKTGNNYYLEDAKTLLTAIMNGGINQDNKLIRPGDTWTNKDVYNLSYFSPAALRMFNIVQPGVGWDAILDANYAYMRSIQQAGAVPFFPDWSNAAGAPVDPDNGSAKNTYMLFDKESVRIPWRIAWDYYWSEDSRAKDILTDMSTFIATSVSNNPANLPQTSYNYSTGALSESRASGVHYTGAYCLMGLGVNPDWINACADTFNAYTIETTAGYSGTYFKEILQMLFSSLMNGWFKKPY